MGDHTETVQLDYDPRMVSYQELLEVFWRGHAPTRRSWSRQYMAAVFYDSDEQRKLAEVSKEQLEDELGREVLTRVLPLRSFTYAEDYHQKYRLRREEVVLRDLMHYFDKEREFIHSTAASKLNGYLYGCGSLELLRSELGGLGLSDEGNERVIEVVRALDG
ncbi:MAG: hypothetical protein GF405_03380 [Candidatus Eisenbacteria bacterium]|nr:hypothetical protein [Candidatus Eisenbacteria bacterium]